MQRPSQELWDAVVIGAGPAGAIAARQLALGGGRVLLVERKSFPRRKVCGACWNAGGLELLRALGLRHARPDLPGIPLRSFQMRTSAGQFRLPLPEGLAVSRAALDAAFVQQAVEAGADFQPETRAAVGAVLPASRQVVLHDESGGVLLPLTVEARTVVVADGLGHPSLSALPEFTQPASSGARLGAGCEVAEYSDEYGASTIHMAVGSDGYVGLVVLETGALNVAAAFDAALVRERGMAGAAAAVLREARCPEIPALATAAWRGTPLLTRPHSRVASTRLFLLGDAAGYAEPFTGEGMMWAVIAACAVQPLMQQGWHDWQPSLAREWTATYRQLIGRRQRICRGVAAVLRSPWAVAGLTRLLSWAPGLAQPVVRFLNDPPAVRAMIRSLAVTAGRQMSAREATLGSDQYAVLPSRD